MLKLDVDAEMENLDELLKQGWRRCAVGQGTTQWCSYAEQFARALKAAQDALDDPRVDNTVTLEEAIARLRMASVSVFSALPEDVIAGLRNTMPEHVGWIEFLTEQTASHR